MKQRKRGGARESNPHPRLFDGAALVDAFGGPLAAEAPGPMAGSAHFAFSLSIIQNEGILQPFQIVASRFSAILAA